ncbi:hypothetical protein A5703_11460 [Mycobacterium sp. E188]|uniref:hypothetical protein n=1 Tax=Mycobacterium sp. E188 TaxID=1834130 RepID=UPI0007FF8EBC|nr:hypothetical protein [Mycobacterium sp. E188]OBG67849.1 hypothetical protein A5703_11460 [Mycobacterium sp. E188]
MANAFTQMLLAFGVAGVQAPLGYPAGSTLISLLCGFGALLVVVVVTVLLVVVVVEVEVRLACELLSSPPITIAMATAATTRTTTSAATPAMMGQGLRRLGGGWFQAGAPVNCGVAVLWWLGDKDQR